MKKTVITSILLLLMGLFLAACSSNDSEGQTNSPEDTTQQEKEGTETADTQEEETEARETDEGDTTSENSSDEYVEHQKGLQIGETGTVVSSKEDYKYEVTLNSLHYEEELDDLRLFGDVFVIADVTIENIDNQSFPAEATFTPKVGKLDSNEYNSPVDNEFLEGISGIEIIEGELEPGDSITGQYVFDLGSKEDSYHFAFGTNWDQIRTLAEWEFSEVEME